MLHTREHAAPISSCQASWYAVHNSAYGTCCAASCLVPAVADVGSEGPGMRLNVLYIDASS